MFATYGIYVIHDTYVILVMHAIYIYTYLAYVVYAYMCVYMYMLMCILHPLRRLTMSHMGAWTLLRTTGLVEKAPRAAVTLRSSSCLEHVGLFQWSCSSCTCHNLGLNGLLHGLLGFL